MQKSADPPAPERGARPRDRIPHGALEAPQLYEGGVMDKLNPEALAEWDEEQGARPEDIRPGVQSVDAGTIAAYVAEAEELPWVSARPFGDWLDGVWNDYTDPGNPALTNGEVIDGALAFWRGQ